jgi:hypothetical protein
VGFTWKCDESKAKQKQSETQRATYPAASVPVPAPPPPPVVPPLAPPPPPVAGGTTHAPALLGTRPEVQTVHSPVPLAQPSQYSSADDPQQFLLVGKLPRHLVVVHWELTRHEVPGDFRVRHVPVAELTVKGNVAQAVQTPVPD